MSRRRSTLSGFTVLALLLCGLTGTAAGAQDSNDAGTLPPPPVAEEGEASPPPVDAATQASAPSSGEPALLTRYLAPVFSGATLLWAAVVVTLMLMLQAQPLTIRNLDAIILALTAVLLAVRAETGVVAHDPTGWSVQTWSYVLLMAAAAYWVGRGLYLASTASVAAARGNLAEPAMLVLLIGGLLIVVSHVWTAPVSDGSRDGLLGGIYMAETGKLPYGDVEDAARSPLLYATHAGAVKLVPPRAPDAMTPWTWNNRDTWLRTGWLEDLDLTPIRLVNFVLVGLTLVGLVLIGQRLHSLPIGLAMVLVFAVFPGAIECFARPDVMLPATLLTWTLALAFVPAVGGLLAGLLVVIAGLAWPWAWLGVPVVLAWFIKHGWHAVGAILGVLGGAAAVLAGLTFLTGPTVPRDDGALALAGRSADYVAVLSGEEELTIQPRAQTESPEATFKSGLWSFLLDQEEAVLAEAADPPAVAPSAGAAEIEFKDVAAQYPASVALNDRYRTAVGDLPPARRLAVAVRTVLEATWAPRVAPRDPVRGTWAQFARLTDLGPEKWTLIRRAAKVLIGVLVLVAAALILRTNRPGSHQLVGGMLVVVAGTLLVSHTGPVANLAWLLPAVLAILAAHGQGSEKEKGQGDGPPALEDRPAPNAPHPPPGAAPRITVER